MFVAIGKHSEHDTKQACFVICSLLESLRLRKMRCTEWSKETHSTEQCVCGFECGYYWRISGQCGHHTAGLSVSDERHSVIHKQLSVRLDKWH
jgi:hypothetical protein